MESYGLVIGRGAPEKVAAAIAGKPKLVREQLLAALEEWRALARSPIGIDFEDPSMPNVIAGILPGGAADRDGRLKRGDRIVGIGDGSDGPITDTRKATTKEIKTLFEAGEREGDLRLQVVRDGETQIRTYSLKTDVSRDWLDAVLETADKERWRARLRRAYDVSDPIERRAVLDRLAEEADVEHQPVRVLTRLGMNLSSPERSAALLKRVCRRYPRDVLSNCFLAMSFQGMGEHQDAVRYYAVAIALRPTLVITLVLGTPSGRSEKRKRRSRSFGNATASNLIGLHRWSI